MDTILQDQLSDHPSNVLTKAKDFAPFALIIVGLVYGAGWFARGIPIVSLGVGELNPSRETCIGAGIVVVALCTFSILPLARLLSWPPARYGRSHGLTLPTVVIAGLVAIVTGIAAKQMTYQGGLSYLLVFAGCLALGNVQAPLILVLRLREKRRLLRKQSLEESLPKARLAIWTVAVCVQLAWLVPFSIYVLPRMAPFLGGFDRRVVQLKLKGAPGLASDPIEVRLLASDETSCIVRLNNVHEDFTADPLYRRYSWSDIDYIQDYPDGMPSQKFVERSF